MLCFQSFLGLDMSSISSQRHLTADSFYTTFTNCF